MNEKEDSLAIVPKNSGEVGDSRGGHADRTPVRSAAPQPRSTDGGVGKLLETESTRQAIERAAANPSRPSPSNYNRASPSPYYPRNRQAESPDFANRKSASAQASTAQPAAREERRPPAPRPKQKSWLEAARELLRPEPKRKKDRSDQEREEKSKQRESYKKRRKRSPIPEILEHYQVRRDRENEDEWPGTSKKEPEEKIPVLPASDLPIALIIGPFLERTLQPGSDPPVYHINPASETNAARTELVLQLVNKSLSSLSPASTLLEYLDALDLFNKTGVFEKFETGILNSHLRDIRIFKEELMYQSIQALVDNQQLRENEVEAIQRLNHKISEIVNAFENRNDWTLDSPLLLSDIRLGLDAHPGDDVLTDRSWRDVLTSMGQHFFYYPTTQVDVDAQNDALASAKDQSPLYRLQATVGEFTLQQRLQEFNQSKSLLPPAAGATSMLEKSKFADNMNEWLLSFPPHRVLQAIVAKYAPVFTAHSDSLPIIRPLRYNPSTLVLSLEQQAAAQDPSELLETYRSAAENLSQFVRIAMPTIGHEFGLSQLEQGELPDQEHFSSSLIRWLIQGGVATLVTQLSPDQSVVKTFKEIYEGGWNPTLLHPDDLVTDLPSLYKLLTELDSVLVKESWGSQIPETEYNLVYTLTHALNPDYNQLTLSMHKTVVERLLEGLVSAGLVTRENNTVAWTKEAPRNWRLSDVARLAGATTVEEISRFSQLLIATRGGRWPTSAEHAIGSQSEYKQVPLWVDRKQFGDRIRNLMQTDPKGEALRYGSYLWYMELFLPEKLGITTGGLKEVEVGNTEADPQTESLMSFARFTEGYWRTVDALIKQIGVSVESSVRDRPNLYQFCNWFDRRAILRPVQTAKTAEEHARAVEAGNKWLELAKMEESRIRWHRSQFYKDLSAELDAAYESNEFGSTITELKEHEQLPIVLEHYIRPFAASIALSVMSIPAAEDIDITAMVDKEILGRYAVPNTEGEAMLTVKSLTTYQLLEAIQKLDGLIQSRELHWQPVEEVLTEIEKILFVFEESMLGRLPNELRSKTDFSIPQLAEPGSSMFAANWGLDSDIIENETEPVEAEPEPELDRGSVVGVEVSDDRKRLKEIDDLLIVLASMDSGELEKYPSILRPDEIEELTPEEQRELVVRLRRLIPRSRWSKLSSLFR